MPPILPHTHQTNLDREDDHESIIDVLRCIALRCSTLTPLLTHTYIVFIPHSHFTYLNILRPHSTHAGDAQNETYRVENVRFPAPVEARDRVEALVPPADDGAHGIGLEAINHDLDDFHGWQRGVERGGGVAKWVRGDGEGDARVFFLFTEFGRSGACLLTYLPISLKRPFCVLQKKGEKDSCEEYPNFHNRFLLVTCHFSIAY